MSDLYRLSDEVILQLSYKMMMEAHEGQTRRDGVTPYSNHPEAVQQSLASKPVVVRVTARLHDVLEYNSDYTAEFLELVFPQEVVDAVVELTKLPGQLYFDYLAGVKANEIARIVKIADINHNLNDAPTDSQAKRYRKALAYLEDVDE